MSIMVLNPGLLTTVQDMGRVGYQQFGVSVSGVMDPRSASIANILVGNDEGEAVLECTMMGPHIRGQHHRHHWRGPDGRSRWTGGTNLSSGNCPGRSDTPFSGP